MSQSKIITIKFTPVRICFADWYKWYGDRYDSKLDAIEVWTQMTARPQDRKIEGDKDEHTDLYLQRHYFDEITGDAEQVIANHRQSKTQSAAANTSTP